MKLETERVKLGDLRPFPGNARKGNVEAIAESLRVNGEYQPIVAQRSTRHVLIGNHRLQAAQRLGWTHLNVIWRDCTDEEARRIVAADNRTHDLGEYDERALAELLRSIGEEGLEGTGYDLDSYDDFLALLDEELPGPPGDEGTPGGSAQVPTVLHPVDRDPTAPTPQVRTTPTQAEYLDRYEETATRFLALIYPVEQYVWVVEGLELIGKEIGGERSNSDVLAWLIGERVGKHYSPPDAGA